MTKRSEMQELMEAIRNAPKRKHRNNYINDYLSGREWRRKYAERTKEKFYTDASVDENGVVTWNSNGNVPPEDILEFWEYVGITGFNREASDAERERQTNEFLTAYRKQQENHKPSQEELYEMRAAFGEGTTVVNVITGKEIKL